MTDYEGIVHQLITTHEPPRTPPATSFLRIACRDGSAEKVESLNYHCYDRFPAEQSFGEVLFFWILSWVQLLCASYSGLNTDEQC